ncbi:uncharacterized protein J4E92_007643 [Alternaria infectoria]|uniref:uncharacterized protein n=1 Tax=Alternaria infectoria TaxID=45303 RepID=UPI00221F5303|nr:uncharacterized protein J4E92_007643 [Alternaria infectoria]KAI4923669.1 hypothetical protein J4E92_007643 [Alternaria infectoria]
MATQAFDPSHVDLTTADKAEVICYFTVGENEYNGMLGARISSIFVIGFVSTLVTYFPVVARQKPSWKIPLGLYTFARFFGAEVYVERHFGVKKEESEVSNNAFLRSDYSNNTSGVAPGAAMVDPESNDNNPTQDHQNGDHQDHHRKHTASLRSYHSSSSLCTTSTAARLSFAQQIGAFLVLEFGIIFHSVIIGLNLGVVGDEFKTLYPVLVFHQSFEGLGIGARLSSISFPSDKAWMPWALCALYGLTTPLAIAVGLGVRTTYLPESKVSLMVQGVLNAVSAGFLVYSGLVELLAKDFLFDRERTRDLARLGLMVGYVFLGAAVMALIGWWA